MKERIANPILPGFYPDPSIVKVEDDFYLVTSTFAYFPGVPIFHSKDLVHWEQIGNVLSRKEQLNLEGANVSHGIYAPTIRYHNGIFYMITTNISHGGNFIVTASNPKGPWSNPYYLKGADGIDPSLFFDDDGRCYYTATKARREGAKFFGDNEIYLQELDLETMSLIGESYPIWHGALREVEWAEGPHIYKKDGYYYLLISEAGTGHNHALTIARSKVITEYFEGNPGNPILTHRHLGIHYPIVNVGHGDLVEVKQDEWYMVLLASRPYGGYYRNLGRETFIVPVTWENGWPIVNYGVGLVEESFIAPSLPRHPVTKVSPREDFEEMNLPYHFIHLRNPDMTAYDLQQRRGYLTLALKPDRIHEINNPSYLGVRQSSMNFVAKTRMEFKPASSAECAGLVLFQNHQFYYEFTLSRNTTHRTITLYQCKNGITTKLSTASIDEILIEHTAVHQNIYSNTNTTQPQENQAIVLAVVANGQELKFYYGNSEEVEELTLLQEKVDGRILSTDMAGGFVGTTIGMYASSNGETSSNAAYFDWFYYDKY